MRTLALASLIVVLGGSTFSQHNPSAMLVGEFTAANCEEMMARIDAVVVVQRANPGSKVLAIFYPKRDDPGDALRYEDHFRMGMAFRKLNAHLTKIVRGKPTESTRVQFWVIPNGAEDPNYVVAEPNEIFAEVTESFLYNTEFGGEVCPATDERMIADLLKSNSNVDLRIVVRGKSRGFINQKINSWLNRLVTEQKVPRSRLHIRWTHKLAKAYPYKDVEFWFVPTRS